VTPDIANILQCNVPQAWRCAGWHGFLEHVQVLSERHRARSPNGSHWCIANDNGPRTPNAFQKLMRCLGAVFNGAWNGACELHAPQSDLPAFEIGSISGLQAHGI
jgi:hypothetical protein